MGCIRLGFRFPPFVCRNAPRKFTSSISEAALFLASDSSAFITGTGLIVDTGLTLRAHS